MVVVALGTATHGHFLKIPSKPMEYVTYTAIYVTWLGIFKKITKIVFLPFLAIFSWVVTHWSIPKIVWLIPL